MGLRNRAQKTNQLDPRFIGRENILEDFAREWSKPIKEAPRFIVNLYGLGGIGKSKLLLQFLARHAQEEIVCKLDANFDDLSDPIAVLKTILRKTRRRDKLIELEETQELITRFEKLVNDAAKSSGELPSAITRMLIKGAQVGGELLGGTETGKMVREVGESAADLMEIGIEHLASVWRVAKDERDSRLLESPVREITAKLVEELNERCKDGTKLFLAFDTYEKVSSSLDNWLLRDLLDEPATLINFDLRLIIAGREPLTEVNRHWHDEWGGELLAIMVEPFTLEETGAFLKQRRGIVTPKAVEMIHNTTRGYPFWLDLWANSGIDPEHFFSTGHLMKIEDRLFEMFPDSKHQYWLRQAAFFYRFNQDLLAILVKDDIDNAFDWLVHQSSLIEGSGKYWKLHDVARKVILTNLRNRSQALLSEPAEKIREYFQQQLLHSWEEWRDLRFRVPITEQDFKNLAEVSYYQTLACAEITDDQLDMILRVLDSSLMRARALFNLSSQALSDIELKLPNKTTFVQTLVEALSLQLTEAELNEKKADLVRHTFTDYQKVILLNSIAKAYGDKLKLVEKALHCFDETLALYPEYESALMSKAKLVSVANPQSAIDTARTVLVNNPDHYDAYFRLGYCYHQMGSYEDAIEQYKRCTEIDPRKHMAHNNWGTSLAQLNRQEDALEHFKKAVEINPKYALAYDNWSLCLGNLGRLEEAIELCRKSIEIDSKSATAHNRWGLYLGRLNRHEEALEHYQAAIAIDSSFVLAYDNWGWSLGQLGRHEEVIELCKKSIELDPKNVKALNRWGLNLGKLSRHVEALQHYKAATEIDSSYVLAYDNWSWSLSQLDRHEEAIELCKTIISLDSKNAKAHNRWGWNLGKLNRHDEALEHYRTATEMDPNFLLAYENWSWSLGQLNRHEEAIELCKKAIELDSKYVQTYQNWGDSLRCLHRYHEAIEMYGIAIELDPKSAVAYNNRGLVHSYLGNAELAISDYTQALAIDSNDIAYHYNMAVIRYVNSIDASYYIEKVQSLCSELSESDHRGFYAMAGIAAVKSDFDTALKKLNRAASLDYQSVREWALSDVAFERMRILPEFRAVFEGQEVHC